MHTALPVNRMRKHSVQSDLSDGSVSPYKEPSLPSIPPCADNGIFRTLRMFDRIYPPYLSAEGRLDADDLENLRAVVGMVGKRSAIAQVGSGLRGRQVPRWFRQWAFSGEGGRYLIGDTGVL